MSNAILLLGSTIGNREQILKDAIQAINKQIGKIKKVSSIYQTAPWGFGAGSYFLNTVIKIETGFDP
ncbi:MAG: 2-amino-4-hydroxy-6-hydroxymethyldihydropteridine diphosphokinase, partial [Bacteroidales bacterium]|nr:2-amino-4-hydroxy-6-hydroxymethyldihydropteridine diphosphokinase [Bacteroidales bacterium]